MVLINGGRSRGSRGFGLSSCIFRRRGWIRDRRLWIGRGVDWSCKLGGGGMRTGRSTVRTSPSHVSPLRSEPRRCQMQTDERTGDLLDGRERRRGIWWDRRNNCLAVEGIDFAQDTQEGGANEFDFIPDSEELFVEDVISSEFVPDSLVQEVEVMEDVGAKGESVGEETDELMTGWVETQSSDKKDSAQIMWQDSQEDEYEDLDDLKLDMLHRMMPVAASTTYNHTGRNVLVFSLCIVEVFSLCIVEVFS